MRSPGNANYTCRRSATRWFDWHFTWDSRPRLLRAVAPQLGMMTGRFFNFMGLAYQAIACRCSATRDDDRRGNHSFFFEELIYCGLRFWVYSVY
jgi:hypothetical protein